MTGIQHLRSFTVEYEPAPFVRATKAEFARAVRSSSGRGKAGMIQRYLAYKEAVGRAYHGAYPGEQWVDGNVGLKVLVLLPEPYRRRWDGANVYKAVEDGLTKVAYKDDIVVEEGSFKVEYCGVDVPFTLVSLWGEYTVEPDLS